MSDADTNELERLSREVRRRLCLLYWRCLAGDDHTPLSLLHTEVAVEVIAVRRAVDAYVDAEPKPVHRAAEGPKGEA